MDTSRWGITATRFPSVHSGYQAAFAADLSKGLPHHFLNGKMYDVVTAFGCLEFIKDHEGLMQDITKVCSMLALRSPHGLL